MIAKTIPKQTTVQQQATQRVVPKEKGLSFTPKLLGFAKTPLQDGKKVQGWQIEVIDKTHPLPNRPKARLMEFLATGVEVTQIALYHELPPDPPFWKVMGAQIARAIPKVITVLGTVVFGAGAVVALGFVLVQILPYILGAAVGIGLGLCLLGALSAVGLDPVLVVQTKAGAWLELDRWDD